MPEPAPPGNADQFLNPKSMITPGIAGGLVMLISQALANQFAAVSLPVTILVLSFVVGLLVFIQGVMPAWQRGILYLLNSLVIFSVAVGTSAAGSKPPAAPQQAAELQEAVAKATQQLANAEASQKQLKEALAKLTAEQANTQKANAELGKLNLQTEAARREVKNVANEVSKAQVSPSKFIKRVF